jgi:AcrR family transcriptional regulator
VTGRAPKLPIAPEQQPAVPVIDISTSSALRELRRALRDAHVRAVVLTGQCSPRRSVPPTEQWDKPVVHALHGEISPATLALACRCHARVAAGSTTLPTAELAENGLLPTLSGLVGATRTPEILVTDELTADRLHHLGIISDVVRPASLIAEAVRLARRLAQLGPDTLAALRDRPLPEPGVGFTESEAAPGAIEPGASSDSAPDLRVVPGARSGAQTRQKILDAAAQVLRTHGYTACRLADIAKLCGTHQTSIYHYFPSKEALVDEVLRVGVTRTFDTVRDEVDGLPAGTTPLERLAVAIRAHLRVVLASGDYAIAAMSVTGELAPDSYDRIRRIQHRYGQYWSGLFDDAREAGHLRPGTNLSVIRGFVAGALNYALQWYDPAKNGVDELADDFLSMILGGLVTPGTLHTFAPNSLGRTRPANPVEQTTDTAPRSSDASRFDPAGDAPP